jgi:hypothetical protein
VKKKELKKELKETLKSYYKFAEHADQVVSSKDEEIEKLSRLNRNQAIEFEARLDVAYRKQKELQDALDFYKKTSSTYVEYLNEIREMLDESEDMRMSDLPEAVKQLKAAK